MELVSVNIGQERRLQRNDRMERTGIFKLPVEGQVRITKQGLEGDVIVSKKHHGGPDQAVYVYGTVDYEWWAGELDKELAPGTFGDNLTVSELESAVLRVGDLLHIGEVTLQVTAPRIPCRTFAARMDDPLWMKKFRRAERPGLYCRVLEEGFVQTGDPVAVESYRGETLTILEMCRAYYEKEKSRQILLRLLNAPIAIRARRDVEEDMRKLSSG